MVEVIFPKNLDKRIGEAISFFWNTREGQITQQIENDIHDQGNRGAVTGGKQLDAFIQLIKEILIENGIEERNIYFDSCLELPGFYRPNKKWDLLVVENKNLIIAIELKSQVGPSFGNNFNNRTEEAMGSALDVWTAYREGVFGKQNAPWLGYLMVLEDCKKSSTPVSIRSPHFDVMPEFIDTSYISRYQVFCNKLILERQYNSACFITTNRNSGKENFNYPQHELSFNNFVASMLGAILSYKNGQENSHV